MLQLSNPINRQLHIKTQGVFITKTNRLMFNAKNHMKSILGLHLVAKCGNI